MKTTFTIATLVAAASAASTFSPYIQGSAPELSGIPPLFPVVDNGEIVAANTTGGHQKHITFLFNDENQLVNKDTGKFIGYNKDKILVETDEPSTNWKLDGFSLTVEPPVFACKSGDKWVLGEERTCENGDASSIKFVIEGISHKNSSSSLEAPPVVANSQNGASQMGAGAAAVIAAIAMML